MQIRFGPFTLDLDTRQLLRAGAAIHLSPKAFDLLTALVQARPNVLSKATLRQHLWPETFVAEANLSNLVAEIRDVLEDPARAPRFIRTVHRFCYAFCAGAVSLPPAHGAGPEAPVCWLQWGTQRFPLVPGEYVVGRDQAVEIRLQGSTVSRRHARIVVTADGAVLEDFGSKNGTYRGSERATTPIALRDGDDIRIGSELVTFHMGALDDSTATQVAGAP